MEIPKDAITRYLFYGELVEKCMAQLPRLSPFYSTLRQYYDTGADTGTALFNNIFPHIDQVRSMLYAQDTTRFSVVPDATESDAIYTKCPIVARRVQQEWYDSNADIVFGESLKVAL